MAENVGSIAYSASIDTKQLKTDAAQADAIAKKTGSSLGDNIEQGSGRASAALSKLGSIMKGAAIAGGVTLVAGLTAAAKASWDQAGAVEQATVGLKAYEKNGDKVNDVLKNLIGYARSDLGVLFNRKDLFDSAQSLKIMGDNTDDLVGHVKILSRSVGLGLSNWDDLNLIVGRVGSTGRLTGEDFDNLTKAGFKLDKNLRNTNITFAELFKQLDKGIPADALNGQANTIKGLSIRMQTAFRGIGDAILGVDSDTSKFIAGGLGDRLTKGLGNATKMLKDFKQPIAELSTAFGGWLDQVIPKIQELAKQIGNFLGPKLQSLVDAIKENMPIYQRFINEVLKPWAYVLGVELVFAMGLALGAFKLLSEAISFVSTAALAVKDFFTNVFVPALSAAWDFIVAKVNWVKDNFWLLVGGVIGFFATLPIMLPLYVAQAMAKIVSLIASLRWSDIFSGIWQGMQSVWDKVTRIVNDAWHWIHNLRWGDLFTGIGKSLANGMIDLIEGALKGALKGLPGNVESKIHIPRFAQGTSFAPGGISIVGERGPELVNLPRGSQVIPNNELNTMSGGGANTNISVSVNMNGIMARSRSDLRDIAKDLVRSINEELNAKGVPSLGGGAI